MPPLHLSTILASTPSTLLNQITRISSKYGGKGHTVLFTLSNNFAVADDLQTLVNGLTKFNDIHHGTLEGKAKGRTLGCLVDSFASTTLPTSRSPSVSGDDNHSDLLSCSIGVFNSSHCVPFRSELRGRPQPQVGRWHAFRKKDNRAADSKSSDEDAEAKEWEPDWGRMDGGEGDKAGEVDWEDIWSRSTSTASSSSSTSELLPDPLREIDSDQIQTMFTLSSANPDTFTHVLSEALPQTSALTLIASPTHFTTGRPVTLFLDGKIHREGAVGLALLKDDEVSSRTEFLGVKTLSEPMTITSREGNMVNELNSSNPTKLLIATLDAAGLSPSSQLSTSSTAPHFKDEEQFALGVLSPNGQWSSTYRITAGDPSSRGGSLSLDAPAAPEVGTVVQFLHFSSNQTIDLPPSFIASSAEHKFAAVTVPEPLQLASGSGSESSVPDSQFLRVLENTFIVPSTRGFIFSSAAASSNTSTSPKTPTWTCSLPGGSVVFEWK